MMVENSKDLLSFQINIKNNSFGSETLAVIHSACQGMSLHRKMETVKFNVTVVTKDQVKVLRH